MVIILIHEHSVFFRAFHPLITLAHVCSYPGTQLRHTYFIEFTNLLTAVVNGIFIISICKCSLLLREKANFVH